MKVEGKWHAAQNGPLRVMETQALNDGERGVGRTTVEDRCRYPWPSLAAPEVDEAGLV